MNPARRDVPAAWPSARQELLLTAALADADDAIAAWLAWQEATDLVADPVDPGSMRLLPLVYRNLARHGHDGPLMPRLKGVHRYWWLRNQGTFRAATEVLRLLADRGIETMVLKGIALSELYYRDRGVRPMGDFDVMVPVARAAEAVAALCEVGWVEAGNRHRWRFRFDHAAQLFADGGMSCDLHWNLMRESAGPGANEVWWQHTVPLDIDGVTTCTLDPTCCLFHVIAHGVPWNSVPSLRWVADAVTLLATAADDIDWDQVVALARRARLVVRMRDGLSYLRCHHAAGVPQRPLDALAETRVSLLERLDEPLRTVAATDRKHAPYRVSRALLTSYLRLVADRGAVRGTIAYPDFLTFNFDLERRQQLPWALLGKATRRLVAGVTRRRTVVTS